MDKRQLESVSAEATKPAEASADASPPAPGASPISRPERSQAMDTLRGVALLGILVMNIPWFALPASAFFNPPTAGGFEGADYAAWLGSHLLFDAKMITIFSVLFGAGIVVFASRAEAKRGKSAALYYRRIGWLLLGGLVHGYLIWSGDILYSYAMCGLWVSLLRRKSPSLLMAVGLLLLLVGALSSFAFGQYMAGAQSAARAVEVVERGGTALTPEQQATLEEWRGFQQAFYPGPAELLAERQAFEGDYWTLRRYQAPLVLMFQTVVFISLIAWRTSGVMLIGMALMKWGVLTGQASRRTHTTMMIAGYLTGIPIVYVGAGEMIRHEFDALYLFRTGLLYNYVGSLLVAMGHIGLVMTVWRAGVLSGLTRALAAVGQMALTNYVSQSIICTLIFNGYGLGLWGELRRIQTLGVVVAIWVFQLIVSPIWLRRFQFGPFEWLWRSLTYWKRQEMRRTAT